MLVTLGFIALVIGVILIVAGYTVAPAALRPGWGVLILGLVLLLIGYLLPIATTPDDDDFDAAIQTAITQLNEL